jgi:hypothetical protein
MNYRYFTTPQHIRSHTDFLPKKFNNPTLRLGWPFGLRSILIDFFPTAGYHDQKLFVAFQMVWKFFCPFF